jgi:hypothetical protein
MNKNRRPFEPKHLKRPSPNALSNLRKQFRHRDRGIFGRVRSS